MITETLQSQEAKFRASFPNGFFLFKENLSDIERYLKDWRFISEDDTLLELKKPGDGNMNYVLRAIFKHSESIIIKQSRPWVEKYPQFEAPIIRNVVERTFLDLVQLDERLSEHTPRVIGFDASSNILVTQDIRKSKDLSRVYKRGEVVTNSEITQVVDYANNLLTITNTATFPTNVDMRKLNHHHIFDLPFKVGNGFNLDEIQNGLQDISTICTSDSELTRKVNDLGNVYMSQGKHLVHGDLYPGSILETEECLYIIDPEFSFIGPSEWDIAIFIAHLMLAQIPKEQVHFTIDSFQKPASFNQLQFCGFIGTEIIRRLIGLAQLPLELKLEEKEQLLREATSLIKQGI